MKRKEDMIEIHLNESEVKALTDCIVSKVILTEDRIEFWRSRIEHYSSFPTDCTEKIEECKERLEQFEKELPIYKILLNRSISWELYFETLRNGAENE